MPDNYITLSQLTKTTKGLINKINAESTITNTKIGDLANLNTTAKTNLVAAINEAAANSSGTSYDDTALAGRVTALENAGYITSYTETDPTVPAWAKQPNKPTYTAGEVGALPNTTVIPTVPTDVSAFNNDAGYLTSYTETDPTVPAWAKQANKPTYTASEVGALSTDQSLKRTYDSSTGIMTLQIGHSASDGEKGNIKIGNDSLKRGYTIITPTATSDISINLPSTAGTLALTSQIPAAQINSDWNATSGVTQILNKPIIPNVPAWALESTKPTYTAAEVGALPSTYTAPVTSVNGQTGEVNLTIPAAQVQSDWNATSGMGVILNKPTIPAATTITNTLASGTLIATINGTNIYAPAYTDADGVSY